ncbi:hypothetical protein DPMN_033021 [Dreissena polymorpha]|uniref:Uncharacterized protein n=1 Tax=Dreissena polymorpha TaxID=45954 RepID=A0A9D4RKT4_DREPO|nr:hypothetical protein DPMN_033021 [Dreissena polymorpha]
MPPNGVEVILNNFKCVNTVCTVSILSNTIKLLYSITSAKIFLFCICWLTVCVGKSHSILLNCTTHTSNRSVELHIKTATRFTCKIVRRETNVTIDVVQCPDGIKKCIHKDKFEVIRSSTGAILRNLNFSEDLLVSCFDPVIPVAEYTNLVIPKDCLTENTTHTHVADGEYNSTNEKGGSSSGTIGIIVGSLLGGCVVAVVIVVGKHIRKRRKWTRRTESPDPEECFPLAKQRAEPLSCTEAERDLLTHEQDAGRNNQKYTSHELNEQCRMANDQIPVDNDDDRVGTNMTKYEPSGSEKAIANKHLLDRIEILESEKKILESENKILESENKILESEKKVKCPLNNFILKYIIE